jgi:energy-converting hydrogenase Eha subunit A
MGWGVQLSTTGRCSTSCLLARVSIDIAGAGRGRCRDYAAVTRLPKLTKASPARWTCRNSMIFLCRFVASGATEAYTQKILSVHNLDRCWCFLHLLFYTFVPHWIMYLNVETLQYLPNLFSWIAWEEVKLQMLGTCRLWRSICSCFSVFHISLFWFPAVVFQIATRNCIYVRVCAHSLCLVC